MSDTFPPLSLVVRGVGWVGVIVFLLWVFEYRNVFQPSRGYRTQGDEFGIKPERVRLKTKDGVSLGAWFYPARGGTCFDGWVVLVAHGNGGNLADRVGLYECWHSLGVAVLAFDYRGYGESEGWPSEEGSYRDAEAAHEWLVHRGFKPARIVAHGESLGGGVVSELAVRQPIGGLVLQSTFTRITDVGAELFPYLPVRLLSRIRYNTMEKLPFVRVPVLILHSRQDSLIRFEHAERNYSVARDPKWIREISGDHNDQPAADSVGFREAVGDFLKAIVSLQRRAAN